MIVAIVAVLVGWYWIGSEIDSPEKRLKKVEELVAKRKAR